MLRQTKGLRATLTTVRALHGWAWARLGHARASQEGTLSLRDVTLSVDLSRMEFIPYLEIWNDRCYDFPQIPDEPMNCVVDVGANIGVFSLYQALVRKARQVFAFEPAPSVFPRLVRNCSLNRVTNITTMQAAIGRDNGSVAFRESPNSLNGQVDKTGGVGTVEVKCYNLDYVLADIPRIDLLKVDTEDHEGDVFEGATETLKRTRYVVAEAITQKAIDDIGKILPRNGFKQIASNGGIVLYARRLSA